MFNFLKRLFTIPGVVLPRLGMKMPTLDINFRTPEFMGWSKDIRMYWPHLSVPGGSLRVAMVAGIIGLGIAGGTYFFAARGVTQAPSYPEAAVYDVAQAQRLAKREVGVGTRPEQATQTLNLVIGSARIDALNFDTISVGKATGLAEALKISGTSSNTLSCDTVTLDGVEAPSLWMGNSNIHELEVTDNAADGLSIGATLAVVSDITMGSTRGTISVPNAANSSYDRIIIDTSGGDSICNSLTIKDVKAFGTYTGYAIHLEHLDVGKLIIKNSIIGSGTGIDTPDFTIATSTNVTMSTLTNNIERAITIK